MDFTFYEIIASEICGIPPEDLFKKTRTQEIVLARFFCIIYRKDVLKMSANVAGARYKIDHALYHHAKKKVNEYFETKHDNRLKYIQFIDECKEFVSKSNTAVSTLHFKIAKGGLKHYFEDSMTVFTDFFRYAVLDNEELTKYQLSLCQEKLDEMKLLYE